MRFWLDYISKNTKAHEDLLDWVNEVEQNSLKNMQKALLAGETHKASGFAYQAAAYQSFAQKYKIEKNTKYHLEKFKQREVDNAK